jgi:ATP-binding cassette subfamily B protein
MVSELTYLNKYLRRYKYHFLLGIAFIIGTHIFSIIPARLTKAAFDLIKTTLDHHPIRLDQAAFKVLFHGLALYSFLILLMAFLKFICSFLMRYIIMSAANKIESELKNEIYDHYQNLPISFYERTSTGNLMTLVGEDVNKVKLYVGLSVLFGLNIIILSLILIPYMLHINAKLTFYSLLPLSIVAVSTYYIKPYLYDRSEKLQAQLAILNTLAQETFSGISVLQAFSREGSFIQKFSKACEGYKQWALRFARANAIFTPLAIGANSLGIILTVFVGGQEVMQGNITIGNIAEFVTYMHLFTWPVITISLVVSYVQKAAASQKRINKLLQESNPIISTQHLTTPIQGKVSFQEVTFAYPHTTTKALDHISFTIHAGESLAIIGATGSGKSTIANLLTRLYEVNTGSIQIDDQPIQAYDIPFLRDQIGYVPQEVFLFQDSIQNNITLGKQGATQAQVEQAIQFAGLQETIQQLPDQLNTMVSERGVTLSGGQKQRIAIARAFIRQPRLLILDDFLSAVDVYTESTLLKNLQQIMPGRTTLIISHRVSVGTLVDKMIVLESGKIVEQGTHQELLSAKGLYYKLYKQQKVS